MNIVVVDGIVTRVDSRSFGNGGEAIEIHLTNTDQKWNKEMKRLDPSDMPLRVDCFGRVADDAKKVVEGDYVMIHARVSGRYSKGKGGQEWHNTSIAAVSLRRCPTHASRQGGHGAGPAPQVDEQPPL